MKPQENAVKKATEKEFENNSLSIKKSDSDSDRNNVVKANQNTIKKKITTIQELKDQAQILYLLQEKHTQLTQKRADLDRFEIVHDSNRAKITIIDANGEEFTSHSPKSIEKIIGFWKDEFDSAVDLIEKELQDKFNL